MSSDDTVDKNAPEDAKTTVQPEVRGTVPLGSMFRFADYKDKVIMAVGTIAAIVHGAMLPMLVLVMGEVTTLFIRERFLEVQLEALSWGDYNTTMDEALEDEDLFHEVLVGENATHLASYFTIDLMEEGVKYTLYTVYIAIGVLFGAYFQTAMWHLAASNLGFKIRNAVFRSIMKQDIGWFDTHPSNKLNTRLAEDVNIFIDGMGDRLGIFLQWMSSTVSSILIGYTSGWKLALVASTIAPISGIIGTITTKKSTAAATAEIDAYASAGVVAEESIGAFKTVVAFAGEEKESKRYDSQLDSARFIGIHKGFINGFGSGAIIGVTYALYGMVFWYGSKLVRDEQYTPGDMVTVFYGMLVAALGIGNALPNLQYFTEARGAAFALWEIIDTVPTIDRTLDKGEKPSKCCGNIEFKKVTFKYPSRKEVNVLDGINFVIDQGQTVALVGSSGCGKSTTVQLLQRFYDPESGTVLVDGKDIRSLNVEQNIGVVSQEPILFGTTIGENISFGKDNATQEEIEMASRQANAYDFINDLPEKFNTLVGERGAALSGGQKQRIAIARALVRDPKILLLDEATSALDTESEATVQAALDKARQGRTTIIIAHRLSTVKTADLIMSLHEGKIAECGSHEELMKDPSSIYNQLVTSQLCDYDDVDEKGEDDDSYGDGHNLISETNNVRLRKYTGEHGDIKVPDMYDSETRKQTNHPLLGHDVEVIKTAPLMWAMSYNKPEYWLMALGSLGALLNGFKQPTFSLIYAEIFAVFEEPIEDQAKLSGMYSLSFVGLGVIATFAVFMQNYFFTYSGACLTMRLRSKSFKQLLYQDAEFYDNPNHSTGTLVADLASHSAAIQGASGPQLGFLIQIVAGLGGAVIIGLIYSWKLTLVLLAFAPLVVISGIVSAKQSANVNRSNSGKTQKAAALASEAISNIRTVTSLSKHDWFIDNYLEYSTVPLKEGNRNSYIQGITYGWTQSIFMVAYAASFYYGSYLVAEKELLYTDMLKVLNGIVLGAISIGMATKYMPDYSKGKRAADYLYTLFEHNAPINGQTDSGDTMEQVIGQVTFKDVHFNYPSRPTVNILDNLTFDIKEGEHVALVGSSGCGKSTSMQLIERLYDPIEGYVMLDNIPINKLNVRWLRSKLGLVSQEPTLFDNTIAENIAYGDNTRTVSMNEIIAAARNANIHNFIKSLPQGYDTNVGSKGAQLSGGQKQRIAIARALVRDPKVLLLDEATSALDTESEKVVQEALDAAQEGRTCITIAHRLSTIVNSDQIFVLYIGKIVEAGTHTELLALQGHYYNLNQAQLKVE